MSIPLVRIPWKVMPMGVNAALERMLENFLEPVRDFAVPFVDPSMSYDQLLAAHERDIT